MYEDEMTKKKNTRKRLKQGRRPEMDGTRKTAKQKRNETSRGKLATARAETHGTPYTRITSAVLRSFFVELRCVRFVSGAITFAYVRPLCRTLRVKMMMTIEVSERDTIPVW